MSGTGLRIAVVGATGALGGEVLASLDAADLRIAEIVPVATDRSVGEEIEFRGTSRPVVAERDGLHGLDLVLCCAPPEPSLAWVREALRAEVPCIDCSGSLADQPDVPLRLAALPAPDGLERAPVVATPSGPALAWSLVLAPLHRRAEVRRVVGTVLETAGAGGRDGIAALSLESLALFNQQEVPDDEAVLRPLAFDCHPALEEPDAEGRTASERRLQADLRRLLGGEIRVAATIAQMPAFIGQASSLAVETERAIEVKEVEDHLAQAEGVELWTRSAEGPNLRAAAGRDVVIAGRIRRDPAAEALQLWIVADVLRLAAANAVALAVERLRTH